MKNSLNNPFEFTLMYFNVLILQCKNIFFLSFYICLFQIIYKINYLNITILESILSTGDSIEVLLFC